MRKKKGKMEVLSREFWKPPTIYLSLSFKKFNFQTFSFNLFHFGNFDICFVAVVSPCSHTLLYLKWVFYVDHHTGKVISPHQPKFKQKKKRKEKKAFLLKQSVICVNNTFSLR